MENGNNFTLKSLLKVLNGLNIDFNDFINRPSLLSISENKSSISLNQIIQHLKISKKEFSIVLGYKNTTLIINVLTGRNDMSDNLIKNIFIGFPEFNPDWIKTGSGKMLQ